MARGSSVAATARVSDRRASLLGFAPQADNNKKSKHVAELLELAGAAKISRAVRLQLDALKEEEDDKVLGMIEDFRREASEEVIAAARNDGTALSPRSAALAGDMRKAVIVHKMKSKLMVNNGGHHVSCRRLILMLPAAEVIREVILFLSLLFSTLYDHLHH